MIPKPGQYRTSCDCISLNVARSAGLRRTRSLGHFLHGTIWSRTLLAAKRQANGVTEATRADLRRRPLSNRRTMPMAEMKGEVLRR